MDDRVAKITAHRWWHTIDIAPGVSTPGGWDLRGMSERLPWPDVTGKRCLDVGTMDGFWAFELERRGAAKVVATDIALGHGDVPARRQAKGSGEPLGKQRFAVAAELLGSRAEYSERNVYDLDPATDGEFDVVVVGFVLQLLRDTVSLPLSLLPSPLARLDARRGALEWFVFNRRGLIQAVDHAGFEVEVATRIFRDEAGVGASGSWRHRLGILGRSCAIRARPANI